eukprot:UN24171
MEIGIDGSNQIFALTSGGIIQTDMKGLSLSLTLKNIRSISLSPAFHMDMPFKMIESFLSRRKVSASVTICSIH